MPKMLSKYGDINITNVNFRLGCELIIVNMASPAEQSTALRFYDYA